MLAAVGGGLQGGLTLVPPPLPIPTPCFPSPPPSPPIPARWLLSLVPCPNFCFEFCFYKSGCGGEGGGVVLTIGVVFLVVLVVIF